MLAYAHRWRGLEWLATWNSCITKRDVTMLAEMFPADGHTPESLAMALELADLVADECAGPEEWRGWDGRHDYVADWLRAEVVRVLGGTK